MVDFVASPTMLATLAGFESIGVLALMLNSEWEMSAAGPSHSRMWQKPETPLTARSPPSDARIAEDGLAQESSANESAKVVLVPTLN
jgi:hypothetical protein